LFFHVNRTTIFSLPYPKKKPLGNGNSNNKDNNKYVIIVDVPPKNTLRNKEKLLKNLLKVMINKNVPIKNPTSQIRKI